jgi:pyruvate/2-oxoglutarate dehydrogenase complex dihydrolipoamide acyltransferase (E2) component
MKTLSWLALWISAGVFICPPLWAQTATVPESAAAPESTSAPESAAPSALPVNEAPAAAPKKLPSATINLQTTVTGSQEQPRVLYILPWQSPLSPEMDLELLSSQQTGIFGHIEREELTRSLEAAGQLDEPED